MNSKQDDSRDIEKKDPYGFVYLDWADTAAEVELIIGIITVSLILISGGGWLYALGTAVGFLILEALTLLVFSMAKNIIYLRQQMDTLLEIVTTHQAYEACAELPKEDDEEDGFRFLRIILISGAIVAGVLLFQRFM